MKKRFKILLKVINTEIAIHPWEQWWTFLGSFLGIACIGLINQLQFPLSDYLFLIGSFGATCVLLFGLRYSPFAQPRNLIGGHLISAFVGVSVHLLIPDVPWLASALAVSLSILAMQITKTMHPPGGATALIANIGSSKITGLGYFFIISPILLGVIILFILAMIINNVTPHRSYPNNKEWYKLWKRKY